MSLDPEEFVLAVTKGMEFLFEKKYMPELILEPGRCITSSNQILLLSVHQVKERKKGARWAITDGGIGTVTMPTYYEFHKVLLCNDVFRKNNGKITISGPGCFAADMVYRNISMPVINPGDILAIMDSGAYFTSWESSFGFPLPAIISATRGEHHLIRRRETYSEKMERDNYVRHSISTPQSI